jgi:hypothetical protein
MCRQKWHMAHVPFDNTAGPRHLSSRDSPGIQVRNDSTAGTARQSHRPILILPTVRVNDRRFIAQVTDTHLRQIEPHKS